MQTPMPITPPLIKYDQLILDYLKIKNCREYDNLDFQLVLRFHLINNGNLSSNEALATQMIASYPNSAVHIINKEREDVLGFAYSDCYTHYIKVTLDEPGQADSVEIVPHLVSKYSINLFKALIIKYPDMLSIDFQPGQCYYSINPTILQKAAVMKINLPNAPCAYYDVSIPPYNY